MLGEAKRFPNDATNAIACDGIADSLGRDSESQAGVAQGVRIYSDAEAGVAETAAFAIRALEIDFTEDPVGRRKASLGRRILRSR
jgi:hypothetical protein